LAQWCVNYGGSVITVSSLHQALRPYEAIPEGFKPKGALDCVAALAEAPASAAVYALPPHLLV
jgi:hypothetical protein